MDKDQPNNPYSNHMHPPNNNSQRKTAGRNCCIKLRYFSYSIYLFLTLNT